MKAVYKFIIGIAVTVAVLLIAFFGVYFFVRSEFGIDLFRTAGQLKTLTEQVNETELCPHAYGDGDFCRSQKFGQCRNRGADQGGRGKGLQRLHHRFQRFDRC